MKLIVPWYKSNKAQTLISVYHLLLQANKGANPSTEEADEGVEDGVETVNNVVYSMRLQSTQFDKKSYLTYLKGYMKKVKTELEERSKADGATEEEKARPEKFTAAAQNYAKKIVANFKDWEFYTGESMDPDGMVVLLNYREDGTTPYLVYFKDGLKIEKVVCISFLPD
jgi:hypothetical protein